MAYIPEVVLPAGVMIPFCGVIAPKGWLWCHGQAIDRTEYSELFSNIQTVYGDGDGQTTFNVPDCRGRVIIGSGSGPGLTKRNEGELGGEDEVVLSDSQYPNHDHWMWGLPTDIGYTNETEFTSDANNKIPDSSMCSVIKVGAGTWNYSINPIAYPTVQPINTGTTAYDGSNTPHNNIQPGLVISGYIIKA